MAAESQCIRGAPMKKRVKRHAVTQPLDKPYRFIPLTQGQVAIVDAEDFEFLSQWNWFAWWSDQSRTFYAIRNGPQAGEIRIPNIVMHREIAKCKTGEECDHKNFNGLDNRKTNLRPCTRSESMMNRRIQRSNKCGYKGVVFDSRANKGKPWRAVVSKRGKRVHLGYFLTKEAAARAYDAGAKIHHGEFAQLNFD
jgi:AP2 domain